MDYFISKILLANYYLYDIISMYARKLAYNKKGNIQFCNVECLPNKYGCDTYHKDECHFFISITNAIRRDKMIQMYLRTFKIKILFFISIKPPFL